MAKFNSYLNFVAVFSCEYFEFCNLWQRYPRPFLEDFTFFVQNCELVYQSQHKKDLYNKIKLFEIKLSVNYIQISIIHIYRILNNVTFPQDPF